MKIAILVFGDLKSDPRVEREAQALTEAGYTVRIFALKRDELPGLEQRNGFEILRCADFTTAGVKHPLRKWRQQRVRARDYAAALTSWCPAVIQACDADTLVIADRAATALKVPFVFDAHELFSDMLQASKWSGSWPVQAYWKRIEHRLIPKAARVLTVSEPRAEVLRQRYGVEPAIQLNVSSLMPLQVTGRLHRELELPASEIIVLYQGGLGVGRDLPLLVEAFALGLPAHLVIQGYGVLEKDLKETIAREGLEKQVHFMGRIPADQLHEYACDAAIGVVSCSDANLNNRLAAPNKLYGYMMAALPIIGSDVPAIRPLVEGERIGRCFKPGDLSSLREALSEMIGMAQEAQADPTTNTPYAKMSARARQLAEQRYNWEAEKHILLDLYEEVLA